MGCCDLILIERCHRNVIHQYSVNSLQPNMGCRYSSLFSRLIAPKSSILIGLYVVDSPLVDIGDSDIEVELGLVGLVTPAPPKTKTRGATGKLPILKGN